MTIFHNFLINQYYEMLTFMAKPLTNIVNCHRILSLEGNFTMTTATT